MAAGARYRHERALSAPTRVVGMSARCPHRRALLTPARVISPSRCRQPPHDVNDPPHGADNARPSRQRALELAPGPTTRVHTQGGRPHQGRARCGHGRQRASTPKGGRPHQGQTPGGLLRIAHHPLGVRTQGPRFKKHAPHTRAGSSPCVRHQRTRTPKKDGAKEQTHQPTANQTSKPANPRRKGRLTAWGPARTTWEVAPTPPGEPRPQRRPTAVASPRGAGRRCHP